MVATLSPCSLRSSQTGLTLVCCRASLALEKYKLTKWLRATSHGGTCQT